MLNFSFIHNPGNRVGYQSFSFSKLSVNTFLFRKGKSLGCKIYWKKIITNKYHHQQVLFGDFLRKAML